MVLFAIMAFGATAFGETDPKISDIFQFDASKIDVGDVYHYTASDIKGRNGMDTFVYVKSKDTLVVIKDYKKVANEFYIINWTFDWNQMMMKHAEAYNPLNNQKLPNIDISTVGQMDYQHRKFTYVHIINDQYGKKKNDSGVLNLIRLPNYDYTFFHFDLQFAMRFLKSNIKSFKMGNFFFICNEGSVKYVGNEKVKGIMCRKYKLRLDGILAFILNSRGYIWLAKDDPRHYCVKYINYQRRNWTWGDFKLDLVDIKKMTPAEWDELVAGEIKQANEELDLKQ